MALRKHCFRPLSGSYISQFHSFNRKNRMITGFRPLSGSYISQQWWKFRKEALCSQFPSPIGELHFSIGFTTVIANDESFPSPIGELHFSIIIYRYTCIGSYCNSFRPLSGSYISQYQTAGDSSDLRDAVVSVPYRGATFLNSLSRSNKISCTCFRPLSGSYISQLLLRY